MIWARTVFLVLLASASARAEVPTFVAASVSDPDRPADQIARDAWRKPAEAIAFAGLRPGDRVGDFMAGGGYFTRIFSRVVGPQGRVYVFLPVEELENCAASETVGAHEAAADPRYGNIVLNVARVDDYAAPEALDMVWTAQNYHDLYDSFMGPADIARVNGRLYAALKPGGVLIVIDHVAEAGSGTRDTATLHRVDPAVIVKAVEAAGFRLEAQSDLLRNPADDHRLRVFDPAIRGRTDQVLLKFRKPVRS
jgi:predicted methyltransferase